ncbi:hypothetical protein HY407_04530 [Candidatus Gottesmanbacteria bacterium]|nr:hypothetical protein [Candidatus Gottesmanbacteria bacterium]
MKKSKHHKVSHRRQIRHYQHINFLKFVFSLVGLSMLLVITKVGYLSLENSPILGTYIVKGGDDSSGSGSSGGSDQESNSGSSDDSDSNSGSDGTSGSGSNNSGSGNGGIEPTKVETRTSSGVRTTIEIKDDEEREEIRLSETERIRVRTKDDRTRIDITSNGVKVRLEYRDDRVIVKAEQEDGTEVELEDETLLKIDDRLAQSQIKVATGGANKLLIARGTTGALTDFPLSIDLATNTLIVNTPAGQKEVAILPDQAVQNILAAGVISRLGGQTIVNEVLNSNLTSVSDVIKLGESNGIPVYEIQGISDQKLLGFIPIPINKTTIVSAETGEILETEQPLIDRILDLVAF